MRVFEAAQPQTICIVHMTANEPVGWPIVWLARQNQSIPLGSGPADAAEWALPDGDAQFCIFELLIIPSVELSGLLCSHFGWPRLPSCEIWGERVPGNQVKLDGSGCELMGEPSERDVSQGPMSLAKLDSFMGFFSSIVFDYLLHCVGE